MFLVIFGFFVNTYLSILFLLRAFYLVVLSLAINIAIYKIVLISKNVAINLLK